MVKLTRRAVVQAAIEADYGTPAVVGPNDGILVSEPEYTIDASVLERDNVANDLSPQAVIMGRKLAEMTFTTELRSNGKRTGNAADAALITRLFRACGYSLTEVDGPAVHGVFQIGDHANAVDWDVDVSGATNTDVRQYVIEVTTGGASGVAKVEVSSAASPGLSAFTSGDVSITTATALPIGPDGLEITPTFVGDLEIGQRWVLWLLPVGLRLDPISDDFESITLVMNKDGVQHTMPGSYGTFEIAAEAGQYASVSWTFTGTWVQPVDQPLPNPSYEKTLPAQVELARLRIDGFYAVVANFTFDQGNEINVRPDVSSPEGYIGTRITSRSPEGGIDPEAESVASHDFWGRLGSAERMPFQMRVGKNPGNIVWIIAPSTQYTGLTYADRDGILSYDAGLRFSRYNGNDEIMFFFH